MPSEYELPKKLPEQSKAVLEAIGLKKGSALTNIELLDVVPERLHTHLNKRTSNMAYKGELEGIPGETPRTTAYALSAYGAFLLKNIHKIEIVPYTGRRPYKKRSTAPDPAPQQEQIEINISSTANNVADQITALIDENAQYRKLMLQVHHTIGKALQLDKEKDDGNSTTD